MFEKQGNFLKADYFLNNLVKKGEKKPKTKDFLQLPFLLLPLLLQRVIHFCIHSFMQQALNYLGNCFYLPLILLGAESQQGLVGCFFCMCVCACVLRGGKEGSRAKGTKGKTQQ